MEKIRISTIRKQIKDESSPVAWTAGLINEIDIAEAAGVKSINIKHWIACIRENIHKTEASIDNYGWTPEIGENLKKLEKMLGKFL